MTTLRDPYAASATADLPVRITRKGAAEFLGCSERQVDRLIRAGDLVATQHVKGTTSRVYVCRDSVEEYLAKSRV